jgi:fumarate hydratase class II
MDIEGSEIEVLCHADSNLIKRFKCIVLEFHHLNEIINELGLKIYSKIFDKILKTHFVVHIHPNNNSNISIINNNKIPGALEITFINKKITQHIKKISYNLPHKLDKDCIQNRIHIKCPEIFYK